jgi:hypothetical protein
MDASVRTDRNLRTMLVLLTVVVLALAFCTKADARDLKVRTAFVKAHPCPSTGGTRLPCPGYVVDHAIPLCAGGPDAVENLQWQTYEASKKKDRAELAICRRIKACTVPFPQL